MPCVAIIDPCVFHSDFRGCRFKMSQYITIDHDLLPHMRVMERIYNLSILMMSPFSRLIFAVVITILVITILFSINFDVAVPSVKKNESFEMESVIRDEKVKMVSFVEFEKVVRSGPHLSESCAKDLRARMVDVPIDVRCDDHRLSHYRESAIKKYLSGFMNPEVGPRITAKLQEACARADEVCIKMGLHGLANTPWNIAILRDDVENGYPHTMGSVICLPFRILAKMESVTITVLTTLIHEKIHVFQRSNPRNMLPVTDSMGYVYRVRRRFLPVTLRERLRSNPDLDEYLYGYKHNEICAALYPLDRNPSSLADVVVYSISLSDDHDREGSWHVKESVGREYNVRSEHPWEKIAYIVSERSVQNYVRLMCKKNSTDPNKNTLSDLSCACT